jgi:hypothetical protein
VNADDFRARVDAKAGPDLTYGAVAKAVEVFVRRGRLAERDVVDCIMHAGTIAGTAQTFEVDKQRRHSTRKRSPTRDHPEAVLDRILLAADALIRHIRKTAFGTESPPFRSVEDAITSLRRSAPSERKRQRLRTNSLKDIQVATDALDRANALDPFTFRHLSEQMDSLLGVPLPHASAVARCSRQIRLLTRVTGLSGMEEYVLAGVRPRPLRPRFHIEEDGLALDHNQIWQVRGWPSKGNESPWVRFPRVVIELDACLITETEFRSIYSAVRKTLGLKNQRPTNHRDRQLIATVHALGGLPRDHPNKASFWKAVRATPGVRGLFPSHAAAREAYRRAIKRAARASG